MNARDILGVCTVWASLGTALGWRIVDRHPRVHLERRCNETVNLPCPSDHADSYSRAGTLGFFAHAFWNVSFIPNNKCKVFVGFEDGCKDITALYLNIRELMLPKSAHISIYEVLVDNATTQTRKLVKQMGADGDVLTSCSSVASVGQLLSPFDSSRTAPVFEIDLQTSGFWSSKYQIRFDYTIVRKRGSHSDIYCNALRGYVPKIFCKNGHWDLWPKMAIRLMCPTNYHSTVYSRNPAYGHQTCITDGVIYIGRYNDHINTFINGNHPGNATGRAKYVSKKQLFEGFSRNYITRTSVENRWKYYLAEGKAAALPSDED